ncbi:glycosyltransferase, MGT family [Agromyces sp. CF514]|uniref:glycosyltransferase n=1 Tax=Agromyces sp. CF514 TaxID=1881031 RepID=UPI0008EAD7B4|nr:nucleotide disphospho-sugar-binding domain-containing protein [Agromyces sp. CF514]SFR68283.1 glycosyltransferase, MGT family [Agromyces sp. CF514]
MTEERRTYLFMPESAYGPTNNCIGIGNELLKRGHRVVFAAERSWQGKLVALGFEEDLVDLAPVEEPAEGAEAEQDAGAFWKEYIQSISPEFRKSTAEQLETVTLPIWEELANGAKFCEPQLKAIIERVQPDVIIEDNVIAFPALVTAGVPFVRITSCNPLEVPGDEIAPVFSGLGKDDRDGWAEFRAEYERTHRPLWESYNDWVQEQGAPALPDLEFIHTGDANLYVYPEVLDYTAERPLDESWTRLDSSVRETEQAPADLPAAFTDGSRPLVYFSLGSLGSADVDLMRRVISVLADLPVNVIVSKGPLHDEFELAGNMWGAEFLPQTKILPLVDLVITHGGNNTTTEALHFGKPMILLPLFWDQYDNAQRVHEQGYGIRLSTYGFTAEELQGAVTGLLADTDLRERIAAVGADIRSKDGVSAAADAIERVGARIGAGAAAGAGERG